MYASNFDIAEWLAYEALPKDINSRLLARRFKEDELAIDTGALSIIEMQRLES